MKKFVLTMIILSLFLVGCSEMLGLNELVDYDHSKVLDSFNDLAFDPDVPSRLPFEPTETNVEAMDIGGVENSLITISFKSVNQEEVMFRASITKNSLDFTEENVKITDDLEGRYGEDNQTRILKWNQNDIYYELFIERDYISKEAMLGVAESIR